MRKTYTLLVLFLSITLFAQVPEGFNYQATVRNNSGALITNQNVNFKFNVIKDSPTGESVYSETHNVLTDDLGTVNLAIGKGTPTTGTFSAIDWSSGTHYLGIELNTGSGYVAMGTTQLLSVPYAIYAKSSGDMKHMGLQTIIITGDISNEQAAAQIAEEAGPLTKNIYVYDTKGLTNLDLNKFAYLESIHINKNQDLKTINAGNLLKCQGIDNSIEYSIRIDYNPSLNAISFPALKSVMNILVQGNAELTSFSAPSLSTVTRSLSISDGNITSLQFPSLSWVGEGLGFYSNLASIEIPSLTHIDGYLSLNNNKLPSSQINAILHKILAILPNPNNGNFYRLDLSQQNPPAPPTGQGITDKNTLISNGYAVTTDETTIGLELIIKDQSGATNTLAMVNLYDSETATTPIATIQAEYTTGKAKFYSLNNINYYFYVQQNCLNNSNGIKQTISPLESDKMTTLNVTITGAQSTINLTNNTSDNYKINISPPTVSDGSSFNLSTNQSKIVTVQTRADILITAIKLDTNGNETSTSYTKTYKLDCYQEGKFILPLTN